MIEFTAEILDNKINIPDELMPLFNKMATQIRFHTISGKGEVETCAHILWNVHKFYAENPGLLEEIKATTRILRKTDS